MNPLEVVQVVTKMVGDHLCDRHTARDIDDWQPLQGRTARQVRDGEWQRLGGHNPKCTQPLSYAVAKDRTRARFALVRRLMRGFQCQVQFQHIDAWFAQHAPLAPACMLIDECLNPLQIEVAHARDARYLVLRRRQTDVGI